jgi:hypothetical protein
VYTKCCGLFVHGLGIDRLNSCNFELTFDFFGGNDWSKLLPTWPIIMHLFSSQCLFLTIALVLKAILNGFKQFTFKGCRAWNVGTSNVITSNPKFCIYPIASNISCEPCMSIISKCWLNWKIPLAFDLLKNDDNLLNRKDVIHAWDCMAVHVLVLHYLLSLHPWRCIIVVDSPPTTFMVEFIVSHSLDLGMVL